MTCFHEFKERGPGADATLHSRYQSVLGRYYGLITKGSKALVSRFGTRKFRIMPYQGPERLLRHEWNSSGDITRIQALERVRGGENI